MPLFLRSASPWHVTSVLALIYTHLIGTIIVNALIGGLLGYAFAPKGWERIPLPGVER
ncbi:MAG: hypothetical protein LH467_01240 [Gemmatimonadaceae bacterium]|nr:hypothetical protein [Gemmatimonadaceae bacterium]